MAVNIWEGAKADALIEAVSNGQNGQKVDKQQGTNNAGKVLAIGSDGLVTPAYSIMPDAVKLALVNCFENVYWNTPDGEQYGKALKDALFSNSVDSRVIYEIPYGVHPGSLPSDTGVAVRDDTSNEDFTILIKGTWVPDPAIAVLLHAGAQDQTSGYIGTGLTIRSFVIEDGVHFRAFYRGVGSQQNADTPAVDPNVNHDFIIIMRNFSKHLFINTYVDGNLLYSYDNLITNPSKMVNNYKIDDVDSNGNPRPWKGTYELFKIFNVALSNQEINELVGTNITV